MFLCRDWLIGRTNGAEREEKKRAGAGGESEIAWKDGIVGDGVVRGRRVDVFGLRESDVLVGLVRKGGVFCVIRRASARVRGVSEPLHGGEVYADRDEFGGDCAACD